MNLQMLVKLFSSYSGYRGVASGCQAAYLFFVLGDVSCHILDFDRVEYLRAISLERALRCGQVRPMLLWLP